MKRTHLRQCGWMHNFLDALLNLLIGWRCYRLLAAFWLNGVRVTDIAGFSMLFSSLMMATNLP
jgi:hypothetical protein